METPILSIIVPVYKVEAYLPKCIDSILAQTFQDFELILVDDGSPDNCPALCDAAAEKDPRIRVIHQKNGGLSAARNAGLDIARGEWIGFIDSDDYIAPEMYETLYDTVIKNGADLGICGFLLLDEENRLIIPPNPNPQVFIYSKEQAIGRIATSVFHMATTKLYRRSFFSELRFPVGRLNEDSFIAPAVLEQASKVVYLENQFYCYCRHTESIMGKKKSLRNYDAVEAAYACWECLLRHDRKETLPNGAKFVLGSMRQVYCGLSKEDQKSARSKEMMKLQRRVAFETLRKGKFSMSLFMQTVLFQLSPMGYDRLAISKRGGVTALQKDNILGEENKMRTRYTIINMIVNLGGQVLSMVLNFVCRMVFIRCLSAEYLGVNGLFTDVLSILSFAELGIGTAMVFSMYEPAARNDEQKLARLLNLYKWMYRAVSASVLIFGLILLPFLPYLIKGGEGIENIRLIYMMYVLNSASSYLLNYKNSIYQAYQKSYIRAGWGMVCDCVRTILQIIILITTHNFILYLLIQFVMQFTPNIIVSRMVDKEFPYLKECHELPEKEERNGILKNIGAMSMHKMATIVVRNTDSLLMSSFIGLTTVGLYSNYRLVLNNLNNLMGKFTNAFSGSVGNLSVLESPDRLYQVYKEVDFLFFVLSAYLTGGLMMLFNPFIAICFGGQYCFPLTTVIVIVIEFYISRMRQGNMIFREAMGLFWNDRYKAVAEAIVNLVVSLLLVKPYGVTGIIGGTIISSLSTCVWAEPYIVMKYGIRDNWRPKLKAYFVEYLKRVAITAVVSAAAVLWAQRFPVSNLLLFIAWGLLYTAVYAVVIIGIYHKTEEFNSLKDRALKIVKNVKK